MVPASGRGFFVRGLYVAHHVSSHPEDELVRNHFLNRLLATQNLKNEISGQVFMFLVVFSMVFWIRGFIKQI